MNKIIDIDVSTQKSRDDELICFRVSDDVAKDIMIASEVTIVYTMPEVPKLICRKEAERLAAIYSEKYRDTKEFWQAYLDDLFKPGDT